MPSVKKNGIIKSILRCFEFLSGFKVNFSTQKKKKKKDLGVIGGDKEEALGMHFC